MSEIAQYKVHPLPGIRAGFVVVRTDGGPPGSLICICKEERWADEIATLLHASALFDHIAPREGTRSQALPPSPPAVPPVAPPVKGNCAPTVPEGRRLAPGWELDTLGEGVEGYTVEKDGATYIPLVIATHPGSGQVGRWLDGLDPARTWKIPNITSGRLHGMLTRRGWEVTSEWADMMDEWVDVYVKRAVPPAGGTDE